MREIVDYRVIMGWTDEEMSRRVRELLPEWQPYGDMLLSKSGDYMYQPMVKWSDEY